MNPARPDPSLPPGYARERVSAADIIALDTCLASIREIVDDHGSLYQHARGSAVGRPPGGRGPAYRIKAPQRSTVEDWVVRHSRRGGAVARVLDDRYLRAGSPRQLSELTASVAARARGVATPRFIAAVVYPKGAFRRADVATAFVPDAADLASLSFGPLAWPDERREAAWYAAGELVGRAAIAGIVHADLNLRNILITESGSAVLLDLDRCLVRPLAREEAARARAARMAGRLTRSRRKIERNAGSTLPDSADSAFHLGLASALEGGAA